MVNRTEDYSDMSFENSALESSSSRSKLSFGTTGNNVFANRNSSVKSTKQFKIICVGESQVGKTSLIQRYIDN